MANWTTSLRGLFLVALSVYFGGFTFYSLVVIPILHERLGSTFQAGLVTQRVTVALNLLGLATLSLGWAVWCGTVGGRQGGPTRPGMSWALVVSSICLIGLFALHRALDRQLEVNSLAEFYTYHRVYLWVSTAQWFANLTLLCHSASGLIPSPGSRR